MWKELSRLPDLERWLGAIKGQFRDDLAIAQNEKAADSDR
jgi:Sec-independent protein translocase protein TatA